MTEVNGYRSGSSFPRHEHDDDTDDGMTSRPPVCSTDAAASRGAAPVDEWDDHGTWGGMSGAAGSSAPGHDQVTTRSPKAADWARDKAVAHTRAVDPPLQDDPLGNALVSAVSGAAIGVVKTGAGLATEWSVKAAFGAAPAKLRPIAGRDIVRSAAWTTAVSTTKSAAKIAAKETLPSFGKDAATGIAPVGAPARPAASAAPSDVPSDAAGRSSEHGTSEAAPTPTTSEAPVYVPSVLVVRG